MTMETDEDVQASATVTAADVDEAEEKLESILSAEIGHVRGCK